MQNLPQSPATHKCAYPTTLVARTAAIPQMSSIVDDTSSLTSLTSEPADRPQQQSQASTSPVLSLSAREATGPPVNLTTQGGKRKRENTSWIWTHGEEVSVDGAAYWQCLLCSNRAQPKRYQVSAGTRAPATHLKENDAVGEEINRMAKRLEMQKRNIEQAVETTQRIQKLKAVGLIGPPGEGKSTGSSSLEWNEEIHKALLVSV
jgi:hypothetical protein